MKAQRDESFRDSIATVDKQGKRNWIYAQQPKGKFYNLRTALSVVYLALFVTLPFIRINGNPLFLFNVIERKFILFGVTFWPQDFFIFGIGFLVFILIIVLFTVVFGRVFCGWACPQTIFMEMVFRKIEYLIEGNAARQRYNKNSPPALQKTIRRWMKHIAFFIISFLIANIFLAYVIGTEAMTELIHEPLSKNLGGFISLLLFTGVFYAVYAHFREQVCIIACPYGRLQGVMTDRNTILVAYDYLRGEPRTKFKKSPAVLSGDCIDCFQCVKVCPTGIDIRNGTQLECINCTACMDACDHIMENTGRPKGLIRYASENGIATGQKLRLTSRIKAYSSVLVILVMVLVLLLVTRKDIDATILRTPGMLFQKHENDLISNLYHIRVVNKTQRPVLLTLRIETDKGIIHMVGKKLNIPAETKAESEFFVYLPKDIIKDRKTPINIGLYEGENKIETIRTSFLGPITIKK